LTTRRGASTEAPVLHVGTKVRIGQRYGAFLWHDCSTIAAGYLVAGTSWAPYSPRTAAHHYWTQLAQHSGVVTRVTIFRGDISIVQSC
jgi:hypothetical protein